MVGVCHGFHDVHAVLHLLQGYLAQKKTTPHPQKYLRAIDMPSVGAWGAAFSSEGGTPVRKEAWFFYRSISGVRCWELEESKGPKGSGGNIWRSWGPVCELLGSNGT